VNNHYRTADIGHLHLEGVEVNGDRLDLLVFALLFSSEVFYKIRSPLAFDLFLALF
jgi:hypothetical protein